MTEKEFERLQFAKSSVHKLGVFSFDENVIIDESCVLNSDGFGFARDESGLLVKINHAGGVKVECNVIIRAFVTIDRATNEGEFTIIGEGTKIDHHCHIAHNAKIGKHNTLANGCIIEGSCEVGNCNTFGAGVIVQRKVKIGSGNIFGSGCVVVKDIGNNGKYVGNPARKLE